MGSIGPLGHVSSLVFCRPDVDPDFVTATLDLQPTFVQKIGEPLRYPNGVGGPSEIGTWKLKLPGAVEDDLVEEQVERWIDILNPRASRLSELVKLGYAPYLDCPYRQLDLSVCIEPRFLKALGELEVSLSIWLAPEGYSAEDRAVGRRRGPHPL